MIVAWTESQPAFSKKVQYRVIDAALGTVEKGWYHNDDAVQRAAVAPQRPDPAHRHVDPSRDTWRRASRIPAAGGRACDRGRDQRVTW